MHYLTVFTALAFVGLSTAWYKSNANNDHYGGWLPNRRSLHCVPSGGQCINSYQCCNSVDQCLIREKYQTGEQQRSRFGQCLSMKSFLDTSESEDGFGFKKQGEKCADSVECADQCCREIKKGRFGGVTRTCGKPGPYTCIWRKYSPNDIFGY